MLHRAPTAASARPVRASRRCAAPKISCRIASKPPAAPAQPSADQARLKDASVPYLDAFAAPMTKSRLQVYAPQEELFDQLLLTPDLDKRIAHGDKDVTWAAEKVEAAVAVALQLAFTSDNDAASSAGPTGSPSQAGGSSSSSASSSPHTQQHGEATGRGAGAGEEGPAGEFGCIALSSDDQCVVDWDSESLWDNAAAAAAAAAADAPNPQRADSPAGSGATRSIDSLASAAVALEAATHERFKVAAAHTFLQRLLYKINRLNHFWYDSLDHYVNERSAWLAALRERIEAPWQAWELGQLLASPDVTGGEAGGSLDGYQALTPQQLTQGLRARYERDVDPPLSPAQQYVVQSMGPLGYCHLLAVGSVDGLVEASRQSRVCAGAANEVACTIFRVLMEEYGTGRYSRKHSTFYKVMMEELGMNTEEEHYLHLLPWQWLAAANQNFLLTERRRHYLRYAGALSFFEINGPSVYKTYLAAGQRCGLSEAAAGYWELHIKEDERHGRQMLEEVALPLVDMYPRDSWELLLGYDQDRFMGARGAALVTHIQVAEGLKQQADDAGAA